MKPEDSTIRWYDHMEEIDVERLLTQATEYRLEGPGQEEDKDIDGRKNSRRK